MQPLPIDRFIPEIADAMREARALVVVAPPGSGKTTRVPPALARDGKLILLQPRRIAARALARRIAHEQQWTAGEEVGWQIRFERRFTKSTQLLVATEGILNARFQSDPLLSEFRTVVIDEFHERSIHADLAIALTRQAMSARDDLRVVVMSATLDAAAVSRYLGGCRVMEIGAAMHPVEISYAPGVAMTEAIVRYLPRDGDVLAFLPGVREIDTAANELRGRVSHDIHRLHGSLDADAQDAAIAVGPKPKIILATNIAETSLTVEGVTVVVDSGLQRVLRFDASSGIDRLETERISLDSAAQRSGRAGRVRPGRAIRLWDSRDILREHREPEIARVDLCDVLLDVIGAGDDPLTFYWFEPPPPQRVDSDLRLLELLGAIRDRKLTRLGTAMHRLPIHPRLARLLLAAGSTETAALICAALSAGRRLPRSATTDSDLLALADDARSLPHLRRIASEVLRAASNVDRDAFADQARDDEHRLLRAIFDAFPDRVARRRQDDASRFLLASGTGAVLAKESGVRNSEFIVAVDVAGSDRGEALIRIASAIERDWLVPTRTDVVHRFDEREEAVKATEIDWYFEIPIAERAIAPGSAEAAAILRDEVIKRGSVNHPIFRRARFAGVDVDFDAVVARAVEGKRRMSEVELLDFVPFEVRREVDRAAPERLRLPSGRSTKLEYRDDGTIHAEAKLQELFGLGETPKIGKSRTPVTFSLLSPNGRPVQVTTDLASFWKNTYPEVRKELRGRYAKHPWPEDPWNAEPTARAKRRK